MTLEFAHGRIAVGPLILVAQLAIVLVAGCGGGDGVEALFSDSFAIGQTGEWLVESDAAGSTAIADEKLVISLNTANTIQYASLQDPTFDDLILEVDATLLAGSPAGSYGVLFRVQEGGGFYRYNVTGEGRYVLERHDGRGGWQRLTDGWEETAAVHQGVGSTNRLKVVVGGPNILLFVNDEPLGQFTDAGGYAGGRIAVNAGTFANPDLQVAFDNVVVREP